MFECNTDFIFLLVGEVLFLQLLEALPSVLGAENRYGRPDELIIFFVFFHPDALIRSLGLSKRVDADVKQIYI